MKLSFSFLKKISHRLLWEGLFLALLILIGALIGLVSVYHYATPSIENIQEFPFHLPTILYDRTGTTELYRLYDEKTALW